MSLNISKLIMDLKDTRWVWALIAPIVIMVDVGLSLTFSCLAPLLVAAATLFIPYLFGIKSVKKLLIAGTLFLIVTGILFGIFITHFMYGRTYIFEEKEVGDSVLTGGNVTPYKGDMDTYFNYSVRYTGEEKNVTIYVNISDIYQIQEEKNIPLIPHDGLYYNRTTLDSNYYQYYFTAHLNDSGEWKKTGLGLGPVTSSYSDMLGKQIMDGLIYVFFNSGLMFYMVAGLFWWSKSAKEERKKYEKDILTGEEKDEEEKEDGGEVKGEGDENSIAEEAMGDEDLGRGEDNEVMGVGVAGDEDLGENRDEDTDKDNDVREPELFECTSCGEDVEEDADKCPHCGEYFEGFEDEE